MPTFMNDLSLFLPNLLGAVAIFVIGWFAALILAAITKGLLGKTSLDNRLAGWVEDGAGTSAIHLEKLIASVVFWLVMAFVLVAAFQTLGLTTITQPLNGMLMQVFDYLPRLLMGGTLLLVAWLLATVLKRITAKGLTMAKVDEKLAEQTGKEEPPLLSSTLPEAAYWFVFLLFLPMVLQAFELEAVLDPINAMVAEVVTYIPNILAAGVLLAIGWFAARIVRRIVSSFLQAAGADNLAENVGIQQVFGNQKLSGVLGTIAYVLILIPVAISALNKLDIETISVPATEMLSLALNTIPFVIGAVITLSFAYLAGKIVGNVVTNFLTGIGFNNILSKLGIHGSENASQSPSQVAGIIAQAAIILFGVTEALSLLGFESLNELVFNFLTMGGQILLGMVIFGVGLFAANWVADAIAQSGSEQANILAALSRFSIVFLASAMALSQMGLAPEIINLAFGLLLGAIAVAFAIAFGMGGREVAARELDGWVKSLKPKAHSA
ncbi:MAG: mechanosensitive ion channel [Vampirovibrio sp.]|nr:mechanosensitive ion channel [Vampirovibrio sp.]